MNLESFDPHRRLDEFRRQSNAMLDELLEQLFGPAENTERIGFQPEADLVETEDELRFYVSIPGMVEDDLEIALDQGRLTIRGERYPPYDMRKRSTAMQEWRYGFFERQFDLPCMIELTSIRAVYEDGVLSIFAVKNMANPGAEFGDANERQR